MLVGAICAIVMTGILHRADGPPHTGYYSNVLVVVLLAVSIAIAYAPWMANYTEAGRVPQPALTASGLAVWGWILRIVVALSFLVLPRVITTSTVLVDNQTAATNLQTFQAAQRYVPAAGNTHPPAGSGDGHHRAREHASLRSWPGPGGRCFRTTEAPTM